MSVKIISQRQKILCEDYSIGFDLAQAFGGGGFSFPCDKDGNILAFDNKAAEENYHNCINGNYNVTPTGIRKHTWSYIEPAIGKCHCGKLVSLEDHYCGACECECGQWYNLCGQELVSPQYWKEPIDYDY